MLTQEAEDLRAARDILIAERDAALSKLAMVHECLSLCAPNGAVASMRRKALVATQADVEAWERRKLGTVIDGNTIQWRCLVKNGIMNAGRNSRISQPRWAHVRKIFAHGSTVSAGLCREFGLDPDEVITKT